MPNLAEGSEFGRGILQRIALHEQLRHQALFLKEIHALPVGQYITLCGGAALHGVYLGRRCSKDLDFYAPFIVARRFEEMTRCLNLPLRRVSAVNTFELPVASTVFPKMCLGIRLFTREETRLVPEKRPFAPDITDGPEVRVLSLRELVAIKLGLIRQRKRPEDFVDIWYGLQGDPSLLEGLRALLSDPLWGRGAYAPIHPFSAAGPLRGLSELRDIWQTALQGVLYPVPPFGQVERDLKRWLPCLETSSSSKGGE